MEGDWKKKAQSNPEVLIVFLCVIFKLNSLLNCYGQKKYSSVYYCPTYPIFYAPKHLPYPKLFIDIFGQALLRTENLTPLNPCKKKN